MLKQFAIICVLYAAIAWYAVSADYIVWWKATLIWNSALGYTTLELLFATIPRFLKNVEDRDKHFPAFRRLDCQNWHKSRYNTFLLGAVTIMIPGFFLSAFSMTFSAI